MIFHQHVPNSIDIEKPQPIEFSSLDDLMLNNTVVAAFRNYEHFYRFSISHQNLMAELRDGYEWWVLGTIEGDATSLNLPKWEPKYTKEQIAASKARQEAQMKLWQKWWKNNAKLV